MACCVLAVSKSDMIVSDIYWYRLIFKTLPKMLSSFQVPILWWFPQSAITFQKSNKDNSATRQNELS